jgi:hypothetical protein
MNAIELALVLGAAAALVIWRGTAMYRYTFKKKYL